MFRLRRRKLFLVGLPVLLVLFGFNHLEYRFRKAQSDKTAQARNQVVVRSGQGITGHNTIMIDESSVSGAGEDLLLHFATLGEWSYDPKHPSPCPPAIQSVSGRKASCIGFMYPLEAGEKVKV